MSDGRHVHAQLVGAAGDGLKFDAGISKTVRPELSLS